MTVVEYLTILREGGKEALGLYGGSSERDRSSVRLQDGAALFQSVQKLHGADPRGIPKKRCAKTKGRITMKHTRMILLTVLLMVACMGSLVSADEGETYEDSLALGMDGEYHCNVPYGYTWEVDYINGYIVGEDVTICTTVEEYESCKPKWAITNILEKQEDGTYVAVRRPIVGQGVVPKIRLGENQVAFVVHSGGSVPQNCLGSYENWVGKVVACSIRKGDVFDVDLESEIMTVYANGRHIDLSAESAPAESEIPSADSSEEAPSSVPETSSEDTQSASATPSAESTDAEKGDSSVVLIVCISLSAVLVITVGAFLIRHRTKA
jgi:hypothetical protein